MRRKLVFYISGFTMGIVCSYKGIFPVTAFILICYYFIKKISDQREKKIIIITIIMFLLGVSRYFIGETVSYSREHDFYTNKTHTCYGVINNIKPLKKGGFELICKVNGRNILCHYKGQINNYYSIIGRKILFTGNLKKSDKDIYVRGKNASYSTYIGGFLLGDFSDSLKLKLKRFVLIKQYNFTEGIRSSSELKSFLKGILFGNTSGMDSKTQDAFSENGTAHILAVSGLHIGILYSFYKLLEKKSRKSYLPYVCILLLIIYGTAASWSVSVLRAVIMIIILIAGELSDRCYDMMTSAFVSSFIIMLYNPFLIFTAGFQMSFLAVLSICFLMPLFREYVGTYLAMVIAVQAGMGPYIIYTFDRFSIKGILYNIPTVFLASIIVPAGVFCFFIYLFTGLRIGIIEKVITGLAYIVKYINEEMKIAGILTGNTIIPSLLYLGFYYLLLFYISSEFFTIMRLRGKYLEIIKYFGIAFFMMSVLVISI